MSQNIKLNMLVGADQTGITELSKIYRAYRTMWRGYKAVVPKLAKNIDVPRVHAEYDMAMGRIAYYKRKMMEIRAQIYDKIHVFVERYAAAGYAQPATAAPAVAVDQNLVNELRRQLDSNPQLKAQVQALLLALALQAGQPQQ
ncbi:MAG: hypothetical protein LIR40_08140 [Bacteroidota bacterium]|nr:hypothetical protein [Bacteroidota bacterium]